MPDASPTASTRSDPARLLDEHGDALFRYARLRTGCDHAAEDAVQETLIAALQAGSSFASAESPRAWLLGVARRKVADTFRKRSPEASSLHEADPAIAGQWDAEGCWLNDPKAWVAGDDLVEREEFWMVFDKCLTALPARQAEAFVGKVLDGRPAGELAEAIGITENHLWVLLHRARLRLRGCLEREWFGQEAPA